MPDSSTTQPIARLSKEQQVALFRATSQQLRILAHDATMTADMLDGVIVSLEALILSGAT